MRNRLRARYWPEPAPPAGSGTMGTRAVPTQPRAPRPAQACAKRSAQLAAGELAHTLLGVCSLGFAARARGLCLGDYLATRVRLGFAGDGNYARSSPGSQEMLVSLRALRTPRGTYGCAARAVAHVRRGHDAGCFGLGVPLAGLAGLAARWGRSGEDEYVLDGFRSAAELLAGATKWSEEGAREAVEYELRARITPQVPAPASVRMLGRGRD